MNNRINHTPSMADTIQGKNNYFDSAVEFVINQEGREYENNPNDPGGETKYGISKRSWPSVDIKNLTESQAKDIYRKNYWDALECDKYGDYKLATIVFDSGVNCGVAITKKWISDLTLAGKLTADNVIAKRLRRYVEISHANPNFLVVRKGDGYCILQDWDMRLARLLEL